MIPDTRFYGAEFLPGGPPLPAWQRIYNWTLSTWLDLRPRLQRARYHWGKCSYCWRPAHAATWALHQVGGVWTEIMYPPHCFRHNKSSVAGKAVRQMDDG